MIVRSAVSLPSISRARAMDPASASDLYVLERAEIRRFSRAIMETRE